MKYLFGHTNEGNAFVVEDYPYGFRLRTSIRYWIETTKSGERFCSQTLNPKTGRWNKPKKSTYSAIAILRQDDNGHIRNDGFDFTYTEAEDLERFINRIGEENLTEFQKAQIRRGRAIYKTREHITFTITPRPMRTPEEQAGYDREQAEIKKKIGQVYGYYLSKEVA